MDLLASDFLLASDVRTAHRRQRVKETSAHRESRRKRARACTLIAIIEARDVLRAHHAWDPSMNIDIAAEEPAVDTMLRNTISSIHSHVQDASSLAGTTDGAMRTVCEELRATYDRMLLVAQNIEQMWLMIDELKGQIAEVNLPVVADIVLESRTMLQERKLVIVAASSDATRQPKDDWVFLSGIATARWEPLDGSLATPLVSHGQASFFTSHEIIPVGTKMEFVGLAARSDLNGRRGVINSFDVPRQRYNVATRGSDEKAWFKGVNMVLHEADSEDMETNTSTGTVIWPLVASAELLERLSPEDRQEILYVMAMQ